MSKLTKESEKEVRHFDIMKKPAGLFRIAAPSYLLLSKVMKVMGKSPAKENVISTLVLGNSMVQMAKALIGTLPRYLAQLGESPKTSPSKIAIIPA